MPPKADDLSLPGPLVVFRRIQPAFLAFDTNGSPVVSRGAFRTQELSVYRSDRVTIDEALDGYPDNALTELTIRDIRDAGCIVVSDEPPVGHICAYRGDSPGSRITSPASAQMAKAAKLIRVPNRP